MIESALTGDDATPKALREQAEALLAGCLTGSDRPLYLGMTALERSTRDHHLQAVQDADPEVQREFVLIVFERTLRNIVLADIPDYNLVHGLRGLMSTLYRRRLPYSDEDVNRILVSLALAARRWHRLQYAGVSLRGLLRSIVNATRDRPISPQTRLALTRLRLHVADAQSNADGRSALAAIDELIGAEEPEALLDTNDDWGFFADEALREMDAGTARAWSDLLSFGTTNSGSKPTKKWLSEARQRIDTFGQERFARIATEWLQLLNRPTRGTSFRHTDGFHYPSAFIAAQNADVLKGLAWYCSITELESLAAALGDAANASFKKLQMVGSRSVKAGNACVWALAAMPGMNPVAQLQRLREQVKQPSARKQVEEALQAAAKLRGLSDEDLEELSVPHFGLVNGEARTQLGDWSALLTVRVPGSVDLVWRPNGGDRTQKSVPADVTRDFPDDVKLIKRSVKDLRAALLTQEARIERLLLTDRRWSFVDWRARYLDHGLISYLANRLIWTFTSGDQHAQGIWWDGAIVDVHGEPLEWLDAGTEVRLWHPIDSGAEHVLAWREWLASHRITQPFKQAHREIYVLTAAEEETETYSNRFAAHILRQHQFHALLQQRGWRYTLQGTWDSHNTPSLDLPRYDLHVEYWVDSPEPDTMPTAHTGIFLYIATDQVRFSCIGSRQALPLRDIPTRVFTEVMRDVDLFVGVCSIGNDPNWVNQGEARPFQGYWWDYSFGDLSATAETRRTVLAGLLPHLKKLEGRWSLSDRFLVIRGDLRSYKIHLGSGNILMEPNDQYLCIVPTRGVEPSIGTGLFLPFEGDNVLAVILSKALMLADDRNIKDPTITRQIVVGT